MPRETYWLEVFRNGSWRRIGNIRWTPAPGRRMLSSPLYPAPARLRGVTTGTILATKPERETPDPLELERERAEELEPAGAA